MTHSQPRTPGRLQRAIYYLRTEGSSSPAHDAWAIGLGLFIGCSPLIGLHLGLCLLAGWAFGLNRVKLYLAANVINPLIMPLVLFAEIQTGSWVRRGQGYPIAMDALSVMDPWHFGQDLLVGSVIIGGALGGIVGGLTFATLGRALRDPAFAGLVKRASDRYLGSGITPWEFARAKLRNDPVYRRVVTSGILPPAGRLLDVGCGQGLLLALIAAAREAARDGAWPAEWAAPPADLTLTGVELRPRIAQIARDALAGAATIHTSDVVDWLRPPRAQAAMVRVAAAIAGDAAPAGDAAHAAATHATHATHATPATPEVEAAEALADATREPLDVIIVFDVLHLIDAEAQERLLEALVAALQPGGRLLVREADAAGGWRFGFVRFGNRLTALVQRRWHARFAFRTADAWRLLLERHGLEVDTRPMGTATFANVLMVGTRPR